MRRTTNENKSNQFLLIALSIVCILLIGISFVGEGVLSPVKQISGFLITPVQKGINGLGLWLSGFADNFEDAVSLREENALLQERVDQLTVENTQLIQNKEELNRLRELFELDQQYEDYEKVGARIIAKESGNWFQLFTIDKGASDGIKKDMNVISGSGLVGIVTEVGNSWSTVRSIIDDNSSVSAMVSNTSDQCIIAGDLRLLDEGALDLVRLTDVDNKVHVGDKVVTSYISEKFLPGILIGYISELNNDSNNMTKSGLLTPVVDFRHLQEVLVILELKEYIPSDTASILEAGDAAPDAGLPGRDEAQSEPESAAEGQEE